MLDDPNLVQNYRFCAHSHPQASTIAEVYTLSTDGFTVFHLAAFSGLVCTAQVPYSIGTGTAPTNISHGEKCSMMVAYQVSLNSFETFHGLVVTMRTNLG